MTDDPTPEELYRNGAYWYAYDRESPTLPHSTPPDRIACAIMGERDREAQKWRQQFPEVKCD